jgi:hypothetical protein
MPPAEDIDEENGSGIGFFHNVWLIINVPEDEAWEIVKEEREILRILDESSPDAETFEELAELVESYYPEDAESAGIAPAVLQRLDPYLDELSQPLQGLELGVAGLAHALASIGCVPVASCRGHRKPHSWADRPAVYAAIDRQRAEWLQPLVRRTGCGFDVDLERPNFLMIDAPSIRETTELASAVLHEAAANWPNQLSRRYDPVEVEPGQSYEGV